jgi:colanic acid/amylovoran biosynthesis protein
MKVVITNQVALNTGDAAILQGLLIVLQEAFGAGTEILVLDRHGGAPQRYYPTIKFAPVYRPDVERPILWRALDRFGLGSTVGEWIARHSHDSRLIEALLPRQARENLREFRTADLIVSTGGTYMVEHYDLRAVFVQLSLAVASGRPIVLFTQSLGPFRKESSRKTLTKLLPRAALILLRDKRSRGHIEEIGVSTQNSRIVADAAFALADLDRLRRPRARPSGDGLKVAISVRSWMYPGHGSRAHAEENYLAVVGAIAVRLVRHHGADLTFISTCQGRDEYEHDDSRLAKKIAELLPEDVLRHVVVDHAFHAPEELRDILERYDLVIATRMHMAILSLCAGTPVIPIAYEFKTKELFANMGLGEWVLDIDTLDANESCARIEQLIGALDDVRASMIPAVLGQHQLAMSVIPELRRAAGQDPNARPNAGT